jgi:hypothetical protein
MSVFPSKVNFVTGDILTATDVNEIGQAINLLDGAQFAAGKNKIINGDFGIWQRGTSFTNCATNTFTADRFFATSTNSTLDVTRSTFTPGTAPVAGYEGQFFATLAAEATDTDSRLNQTIEDVRTFAGQTITISFWAKSTVTTDALRWIRVQQFFGSGGSANVNTDSAAITLTSSWARYSVSVAVPSISGKTVGTGSYLGIGFGLKASTAQTLDLWGVQAEAASTASPFQTASGTKQGEIALCQRYYQKSYNIDVNPGTSTTVGATYFLNQVLSSFPYIPTTYFRTQMRATPTVTTYSTTGASGKILSGAVDVNSALLGTGSSAFTAYVNNSATTAGTELKFQWEASIEL